MKFKGSVKALDGVLLVQKYFPNGDKTTVFEEGNLIILSSKQRIISSLYQNNGPDDFISTLSVGLGGTIDPEGLYPRTPDQSLTGLYSPLLSIPISFTTNQSIPSVTFLADLDQGTGNGRLITEAGLSKASGILFNIKTFPGVPKTSEFGLHFEWTISLR